jgi:hypothetical protein
VWDWCSRWRSLEGRSITLIHYLQALQGCRLPTGYLLVRSFICFIIVFHQTNIESVDNDRRMHLPVHFWCHVCLFVHSSPLKQRIYKFLYLRWGPIPWLLGAEILSLRARAKGIALCTSFKRISNFIIAFITHSSPHPSLGLSRADITSSCLDSPASRAFLHISCTL